MFEVVQLPNGKILTASQNASDGGPSEAVNPFRFGAHLRFFLVYRWAPPTADPGRDQPQCRIGQEFPLA